MDIVADLDLGKKMHLGRSEPEGGVITHGLSL